jgi:hypothetical protein
MRLSCDGQMAVQIEAEDLRVTGRLAMAGVDTQEIERDIDRIRSLGLEELRREWRRLPTALTSADVELTKPVYP